MFLHLLAMETNILLVSVFLIMAAFSSAVQTMTPPVMSNKLQPQEDKSQIAVEEPAAEQQRKFLEFLSALDKVQKNTNPRLVPKTSGLQAFAKLFGKTIKMESSDEGQSSPPFSYQDGAVELRKELLEIYPLSGKHFRKAAPLTPKKTKKRACFWKYCVQSK